MGREKKPGTTGRDGRPRDKSRVDEPETTPDQERGERLGTDKAIARGDKERGHVLGAEPAPGKTGPRPKTA
ncbi:hypothetical protein J0H58_06080 [bacterium]|nr:hypothetical protein [bacterium]